MSQQLSHGDAVLSWEIIEVIGHRRIEIDQPLLAKLHDGGRGHGLGDRTPEVDGVGLGLPAFRAVGQPKALRVEEVVSSGNGNRQGGRAEPHDVINVGLELSHRDRENDLTGQRKTAKRFHDVFGRIPRQIRIAGRNDVVADAILHLPQNGDTSAVRHVVVEDRPLVP